MAMRRIPFICIISALFIAACSEKKEPTAKEVVRPVRLLQIDLMQTKAHSFPAKVESSKRANLSFRVPGKVKKFHVFSGDSVEAKQLLAEIVPYEYQAIEAAQKAAYDVAKVQHNRSETLVKDYLISQETFDETSTRLQVAENDLEQARANLRYTKVYAPYDGIIATTYLKNHEYAHALQPVMSIQTQNSVDIVIDLPERLINSIERSSIEDEPQKVTFSVDGKKSYMAMLKEVDTVADSETGAFRVVFTMPQPDDLNLLPGMAASVEMNLVLDASALIQRIPAAAVVMENNQHFVWLFNQGSITKRPVELDDQLNLISGLKDGELIVAAGADELSADVRVKRWVKERGL